jgi:hypothetical protein
MKKMLMKLACSFNTWLMKKHGVISAGTSLGVKEVHLTNEAFFKMFITYDRINCYTHNFDKLYVCEDGVEYFTLVDDEDF